MAEKKEYSKKLLRDWHSFGSTMGPPMKNFLVEAGNQAFHVDSGDQNFDFNTASSQNFLMNFYGIILI